MRVLAKICFLVFMVSFWAQPVQAFDWRQGDEIVIDTTIRGDLFCAGKKVTISGVVEGDVLCAAQEFILLGTVNGDVRIGGQTVNIRGKVDGNATMVAQSISLEPSSQIVGEVVAASQSLSTKGIIGPLSSVSKSLDIAGKINGDTHVYGEEITVRKNTQLLGAFRYTSDKEAQFGDGTTVSGIVSRVTPEREKKKTDVSKPMRSWPANALTSVIFYLLLSLIINALFANKIKQVASVIEKRWMLALGVGLLACIALPFVSVFLLVTIIGILLIPVPILAVLIATAFGRIVAAQVFGKSVLKGFHSKHVDNLYIQSLVGIPILFCMFKAPFVGALFSFISIILGLGAYILSFHKSKK